MSTEPNKEIIETEIDHRTGNLCCALIDLLENGPNDEDYYRAMEEIKELIQLADRLKSMPIFSFFSSK